nr:MAG TPA: hypothetical protein [Caudoviricetes sp.]DAQ26072.1 MAG TPA: hypothetical protein [Caudoviricetes sp.]
MCVCQQKCASVNKLGVDKCVVVTYYSHRSTKEVSNT